MGENNFISNKIKKYVIFGSLGCAPLFFIGIALFVTVLLLLGLFDGGSSSSGSIATSDTVYSECKGVTVGGKLYSLEDYVAGVVTAENGGGGAEALKAQAVASRTYTLSRTNNCSKTISNSTSDQVFDSTPSKSAIKAAQDTAGQVLTYDGKIFLSEYDAFNNCKVYGSGCSCDSSNCYATYKRLPSDATHTVSIPLNKYPSVYKDKKINGGHGNGMSQLVSNYMAEQGKTYEEILKYFYADGVVLSTLTAEKNSSSSNDGSGSGSTFTSSSGKKYVNFSQFFKLNNGNKAQGACFITSIAIIAHANDSSVTPLKVWNYNGGNYVQSGTITHFLKNIVYNQKGTLVKNNKSTITKNLKKGGAAIIEFGSSGCRNANGVSWTNGTHFVALLDYNASNGKVYVSNPSAQGNSKKSGWISLDNLGCAELRIITGK